MLAFALIAAGFLIYLSSNKWSQAHKWILYVVIFEGALRKWGPSSAASFIYLCKDFIVIGALAGWARSTKTQRKAKKQGSIASNYILFLLSIVGIFIFISLLTGVASIDLTAKLFGAKFYLLYPFLIFSYPDAFSSSLEFVKHLKSLIIISIPVCLIAFIQYFAPASSPINTYVAEEAHVATIGEYVRVTGTFSYLAGFQVFNSYIWSFVLPFLLTIRSLWSLTSIYFSAALILITSLMSGSRGVVFGNFLTLLITSLSVPIKSLIYFVGIPFLVIILLSPLVNYESFWIAFGEFTNRLSGNQDVGARLYSSMIEQPIDFFNIIGLGSYGPGSSNPAVAAFANALNLNYSVDIFAYGTDATNRIEAEMGRIILEIGFLGGIAWIVLRIFIAISLINLFFSGRAYFYRLLALSVGVLHILSLTAPLVFNHIHQPFYWFTASFIFIIPSFDQISAYLPAKTTKRSQDVNRFT